MSTSRSSLMILPAPTEQRAAALEMLLGELTLDERNRRVAQILAETQDRGFSGLFVAIRQRDMAGAIWARPQTGRIASLWAPQLTATESDSTRDALLAAADTFLAARDIRLVQTLLPTDAGPVA